MAADHTLQLFDQRLIIHQQRKGIKKNQFGEKLQWLNVKQDDHQEERVPENHSRIAQPVAKKEDKMLVPDEDDEGDAGEKRQQVVRKAFDLLEIGRGRGGNHQQCDGEGKHGIAEVFKPTRLQAPVTKVRIHADQAMLQRFSDHSKSVSVFRMVYVVALEEQMQKNQRGVRIVGGGILQKIFLRVAVTGKLFEFRQAERLKPHGPVGE